MVTAFLERGDEDTSPGGDFMYTAIVDYLSTHLVVAALAASGLWFYAGYQYLAKKNRIGGFAWQLIGVLLLAVCGASLGS